MAERFPFFSVVIPTYNCADFLERALKCVQGQTFQDFEVIVVDNYSTDHTREVLRKFSAFTIKVLSIHNEGIIAASRNMGIQAAKGHWVAFLDADDVWFPDKLEQTKQTIEANPEAILICHNERAVICGKPARVLRYGPTSEDMYKQLLFEGNALSTSAVTAKRDTLIRTEGFSERKDFVTIEDYEYWMRLSLIGHFVFLANVLGEFHIHGGNASGKAKIHADALIAVVTHHLNVWRQNHSDSYLVQKRLGRIWGEAARILQNAGLFDEAKQYALKSLEIWRWSIYPYIVLLFSLLRIRY